MRARREAAAYREQHGFGVRQDEDVGELGLAHRHLRDGPAVGQFVVAQRVSTIIDADRIIVLDGGRIVGDGTHKQLRAENATYQEIVESQLSAAEAA